MVTWLWCLLGRHDLVECEDPAWSVCMECGVEVPTAEVEQ